MAEIKTTKTDFATIAANVSLWPLPGFFLYGFDTADDLLKKIDEFGVVTQIGAITPDIATVLGIGNDAGGISILNIGDLGVGTSTPSGKFNVVHNTEGAFELLDNGYLKNTGINGAYVEYDPNSGLLNTVSTTHTRTGFHASNTGTFLEMVSGGGKGYFNTNGYIEWYANDTGILAATMNSTGNWNFATSVGVRTYAYNSSVFTVLAPAGSAWGTVLASMATSPSEAIVQFRDYNDITVLETRTNGNTYIKKTFTGAGLGSIATSASLNAKGATSDQTAYAIQATDFGNSPIFAVRNDGQSTFTSAIEGEGSGLPMFVVESTGGGIRNHYLAATGFASIWNYYDGPNQNAVVHIAPGSVYYLFANDFYLRNIAGQVQFHKTVAGDFMLGDPLNNPPQARLNIVGTTSDSSAYVFRADDAALTGLFKVRNDGRINMSSLPTSATGLVAGDIWNNSGVLNII